MDNQSPGTSMDPKVVGIVSYLTIIGWIVALVMNNPKTEQASFHIRQALGIFLAGFALSFANVVPILGQLVWLVGIIVLFIFWLISFIAALNGEQKLVPYVGHYFQDWFKAL